MAEAEVEVELLVDDGGAHVLVGRLDDDGAVVL